MTPLWKTVAGRLGLPELNGYDLPASSVRFPAVGSLGPGVPVARAGTEVQQ